MTAKKLLSRLTERLGRTREALIGGIARLLGSGRLDEDTLESIEELLITSDVGVKVSTTIIEDLRERIHADGDASAQHVMQLLKQEMSGLLDQSGASLNWADSGPTVMLIVGVNGSGKTTLIGKLADRFRRQNKKVLLAACDTFRAAAADQLDIWAKRAKVDMIRQREGTDPAAVAFDASQAALARGCDVLLVDTAGRLHTKVNLMAELSKITRVIARAIPGAPHEALLVLDATTGQNAIEQATQFGNSVAVTSVVLNKMDGTAKGGMALAVYKKLGIPVKLIGIGEQIEDLRDFDPHEFLDALFASSNELEPRTA